MSELDPDSSTPARPPRDRRRALLLVTSCSLFALGIGLNVHRHTEADAEPDAEPDAAPAHARSGAYNPGPTYQAAAGGSGQRHQGTEGSMGKPATKNKSGLYALKGPSSPVPQMARSFDAGARQAGILGQLQQEVGHFSSSPYGAAFANVGLAGVGRGGGAAAEEHQSEATPPTPGWDPAAYTLWLEQGFVKAAADPKSTFSIDVDTGSYSLMRRGLRDNASLPYAGSVRVEEFINYFDYHYPEPSGEVPISITSEVGPCPWDDEHRLVHVGLQGRHVAVDATPPRNLVFLIDVSGSMSSALPLVVSSLAELTQQLTAQDRISIVVYAGAAGTVLPPTPGSDKDTILDALDRLQAGGSTNGGDGIHLAYSLAQQHFIKGGINRVMLATDGDFNVGVVGEDALVELIEDKRRSGVFLSVLGFGSGNFQDGAMEQLADKGNGNYAYIDGPAEARKVLVEQAGATLTTIAKDVKIQVEFDPEVVERFRLVGYTNRVLAHREFADDAKDAGEIGAGHTVTALYEVKTKADAPSDRALMDLKLRYKDPDGERSKLVQVPVTDGHAGMDESSDDFRFSAAVAGFGMALQRVPTKTEPGSMQSLRDLAVDARGADPHCRRAEFVALVETASDLSGHRLTPAALACVPSEELEPIVYDDPLVADKTVEGDEPVGGNDAPFDWSAFVLEVLYLLPPLLGLPLFIMALRRRRP